MASSPTESEQLSRAYFSNLLQSCDPKMRRLAWAMLGSQAAMDDAIQDAYIKAFRNRATFTGDADAFVGWLYRIVQNTCRDHLRSRGRRQVEVELDQRHEYHTGPDIAVDEQVVRRSQIVAALHSLPPDQAAALSLIDGEGLSYDYVADMLEVPRGTVASRVNRAREAMRRQLGFNTGEVSQ